MQFVDAEDERYRSAAFQHLQRLLESGTTTITREAMAIPFFVGEDRCTLVDPQRGIHKPRHMNHLLSITTVVAARGRRIWYADQTSAHSDIYSGEAEASYSFMGNDPSAPQNQWLKGAAERQIAATGLMGLYATAQYCRAQAMVCGTNVKIGFPKLLVGTGPWGKFGEPRASDEGCDAIARELVELASKDDIALSRKLDLFERVPISEEGEPLTVLEGAQAMLTAGLSHCAAHEVAQTFILDGRKHLSLCIGAGD